MSELFAIRVYPETGDPLKSIMDVYECAEEMNQKYRGLSSEGYGYKNYAEHRKAVEEWALEHAVSMGIEIENKHPLYFFLFEGKDPFIVKSGQKELSIPINKMPVNCCTFTFDDSFYNHMYLFMKDRLPSDEPHPAWGQVFPLSRLESILERYREADKMMEHATFDRYIEIQCWTRNLPQEFIKIED